MPEQRTASEEEKQRGEGKRKRNAQAATKFPLPKTQNTTTLGRNETFGGREKAKSIPPAQNKHGT
jgi:hypothetical protein